MSYKLNVVEIEASSPKPFHLLYPNLIDKSSTSSVSPCHLDIHPNGFDFNHVHECDVSQSKDENIQSPIHDLVNLKALPIEEEDSILWELQDNPSIDLSSLLI